MEIRKVGRRKLTIAEMCMTLRQEYSTLEAVKLTDSFVNAKYKHPISWKRMMYWTLVKHTLINKY